MGCSALDGDRQTVADGQQRGHELIGVTQVIDDLAGDDGERVAASGVSHLIAPQGVHKAIVPPGRRIRTA